MNLPLGVMEGASSPQPSPPEEERERAWCRLHLGITHKVPFVPFDYSRHLLNLSAFPITTKSDSPIAAAHRIGLMKPSAASGTPIAL